jgi:hypothetical protein
MFESFNVPGLYIAVQVIKKKNKPHVVIFVILTV